MTKHEKALIAIEHRLKLRKVSFRVIRSMFQDDNYPRGRQYISDSTIRRALGELYEAGEIEAEWRCIYPRFFLVYSWIDTTKGELS